jgi:hypothetical protein
VFDAQYSFFQVLRAPENFEDLYQGQPPNIPIILSDQKSGKDPQAEESYQALIAQYRQQGGFGAGLTAANNRVDPFLIRGMAVPLGAMVTLLLPAGPTGGTEASLPFEYVFFWRLRSTRAYQAIGVPYHSPFDGLGQDDDGSAAINPAAVVKFDGVSEKRDLIVCAYEPLRYAQAEPTNTIADQTLWPVKLSTRPSAPVVSNPIFPGFGGQTALGKFQQGVVKNGIGTLPNHNVHRMIALGDELVVLLLSGRGAGDAVYNFDSTDYFTSLFFGRAGYQVGDPNVATVGQPNKQLGAYLASGVGPALGDIMNNPFFASRTTMRDNKLDMFDEVVDSEMESLGGTSAARAIDQVQESVRGEGWHLEYHCYCGHPFGADIEWSEVYAMAHGISPSSIPNLTDTDFKYDTGTDSFVMSLPCNVCNRKVPRQVWLSRTDAGRRLDAGKRAGLLQYDPKVPQVARYIQSLASQGAPRR